MVELHGAYEFRAALSDAGFKVARDPMEKRGNLCNWYAYRKSALPSAVCETNKDKGRQIVVWPYLMDIHDRMHTSAEIDVTGEAGGVWYTLKAYSLPFDVALERMEEIEVALVAAWNSLPRPAEEKDDG